MLSYGVGITNAAFRTTRGSSDLRQADFAGSAERLELLALELRPRAIGFVGKEAYRGPFGGRPAHGLQEPAARGDAPLRPPVHVAGERGGALGGAAALVPRAAGARLVTLRRGVRALVVDPAIVSSRPFRVSGSHGLGDPGGGVEDGESDSRRSAASWARS